MTESSFADPAVAHWTELIERYYNGCTAGDIAMIKSALHPDVVHWFLAPNHGSMAVRGGEHLARYWRKVAGMIQARWVVDHICASGPQAVVEWSMFWQPQGRTDRIVTRGAEWFVAVNGLIGEIRSYYQMRPETSELDGFPYRQRGYSVAGAERSSIHPDATEYGPGSGAGGAAN